MCQVKQIRGQPIPGRRSQRSKGMGAVLRHNLLLYLYYRILERHLLSHSFERTPNHQKHEGHHHRHAKDDHSSDNSNNLC